MTNRSRWAFAAVLMAAACTAAAPPAMPPGAWPATRPPAAGDAATVNGVVDQLSAADPDARERAAAALEDLPYADVPLVEAAADRDDLPPEAAVRLRRVVPLVRQRAHRFKRVMDRRAVDAPFVQAQALADYGRDGHTDPAWDADARAFLTLDAVRGLYNGADFQAVVADARQHLDAALAAGCDDPDVLAYAGLLAVDTRRPPAEAAGLFARAESAAADGHCGPLVKTIIDGRRIAALAADARAAGQRRAGRDGLVRLGDMVVQFDKLLAVPGLPPRVAVDAAHNVFERAKALHAKLQPIVDRVVGPLETAFPNDPGVQRVKGAVYTQFGWEARGNGFANTVTPQGAQLFADRLAVAEAALTKAWDGDPDDASSADDMLTVELGQGKGVGVMELWFKRAMAADPDDRVACARKLLYLAPKWYGSPDQILAFGHECLAGGNWRGGIPLELVDAHRDLAGYDADPAAYYLRPGVWDDCRTVYEGYARRGLNPSLRNGYALVACQCHQWKVADEQFKALGGAADPALFGDGTPAALDAARATAARLADRPDEQGK